jgi:hypothetical protein
MAQKAHIKIIKKKKKRREGYKTTSYKITTNRLSGAVTIIKI